MGPGVMEQTQVRFLERRMDHDFEIQNDSSTNMNSLQGDWESSIGLRKRVWFIDFRTLPDEVLPSRRRGFPVGSSLFATDASSRALGRPPVVGWRMLRGLLTDIDHWKNELFSGGRYSPSCLEYDPIGIQMRYLVDFCGVGATPLQINTSWMGELNPPWGSWSCCVGAHLCSVVGFCWTCIGTQPGESWYQVWEDASLGMWVPWTASAGAVRRWFVPVPCLTIFEWGGSQAWIPKSNQNLPRWWQPCDIYGSLWREPPCLGMDWIGHTSPHQPTPAHTSHHQPAGSCWGAQGYTMGILVCKQHEPCKLVMNCMWKSFAFFHHLPSENLKVRESG